MQSDIAKVIALIDQRIETLRDLRANFIREFGGGDEKEPSVEEQTSTNQSGVETVQDSPRLALLTGTNGNGNLSRKDEVAQFLKSHGPQTRAQLFSQMSIPRGTLAYVLNDRQRFRRLRDGTWSAVENEPGGDRAR